MSQAMTDIEARTKEDDTDCQIESHDESISDEDIFTLKWDLFIAASNNEWETAQAIYEKHPSMVSIEVNYMGQTALELAVMANHTKFVQELVNHMTPQDLETCGKTAFHKAVQVGNDLYVEIMCERNKTLPLIPDDEGMLPVHLAVLNGYPKIVKYLSSGELLSTMKYKDIERLFFLTIRENMYGTARDLLFLYDEKLASARDDKDLTALHMLAQKSPQEDSESESSWLLDHLWYEVKKWEYNKIEEFITTPSVVLFDAIKSGNIEVLEILLESNTGNEIQIVVESRTEIRLEIKSKLMKIKDPKNGRGLLHYAVLYRRPNIFSFLLEMETVDDIKQDLDNFGNNVLHFAMLGPEETSSTSSPKFQMLEALSWFKKLESKVPHELKNKKNKHGKTPIDIFYDKHEVLSKNRKKEENREDNTNTDITSSDGTSNLHNEQIPGEATQAAASTQNEQIPAEAMPAVASTQNENISDDPDNFKRRLHSAAANGQWDEAKSIFDKFSQMIGDPLDVIGNIALHVAVSTNNNAFVKNLVDYMNAEDLGKTNAAGKTAFHMAVLAGKDEFLKIMIQKNKNLPLISGPDKMLPVHLAASSNYRGIVQDLCSWNLLKRMNYNDIERLFFLTIRRNMYDVAIELLDKYPSKLAIARDNGKDDGLTALHMLAQKHSEEIGPIDFDRDRSTVSRIIESHRVESDNKLLLRSVDMLNLVGKLWEQVSKLEYNKIVELITKPSLVLFDAVKSGNATIVEQLLEMNRELMMIKDPKNGRSLLHYVVLYRQRHIFRLVLKMKTVDLIIQDVDNDGNSVLHSAAKLPEGTASNSSPTIQMEEAVKWHKHVEKKVKKKVDDELKKMRNKVGKSSTDIFNEEHKELSNKINEDAKGSATSGMVVATLIATISFAAALTVPGEKSNPDPREKNNAWFIVFILSNAVALFTSSTSMILFLSNFISSRFTDNEFISLDPRLKHGLTLLFYSIPAMLIAFGAAAFLIFDKKSKWAAYVVASMGYFFIHTSLFRFNWFVLTYFSRDITAV